MFRYNVTGAEAKLETHLCAKESSEDCWTEVGMPVFSRDPSKLAQVSVDAFSPVGLPTIERSF